MIGEYWQVPAGRYVTTIIISWNAVDSCSQMRFKIVWDKYWDLLNNISLTYQSLNMRALFLTFFLRLNKYMHGIKQIFLIKKNNENALQITLHM
jgi:hypothetical protein